MQQMSCGACGCSNFHIFKDGGESSRDVPQLVVKCVECGSGTTIQPTKPGLVLGWDEGADGILCVMPGSRRKDSAKLPLPEIPAGDPIKDAMAEADTAFIAACKTMIARFIKMTTSASAAKHEPGAERVPES